jgi:GMP synthase-like glutamine amidotransferase
MRILSVLHPGGGHSGMLRECARAAGHELVEWTPGLGDPIPGPRAGFDALAVFGGGMNVHEAGRLPWLQGEIELVRDALTDGQPLIGVCLGAQLAAAAGGAEVRRAAEPEIGWFDVELTEAGAADPLLGRLPARFCAYEWHSYAFDLPTGAVELARSAVCTQACRLGERAWAVQFHPEVTPDIVRAWSEDFESDPDAVHQGFDPAAALAEAERRLPGWMEIGRALFGGFLEQAALRTRAARAPAPARAAAAAPAGPPPPRPRG